MGGRFLDFVGGTTVMREAYLAHGGSPSPPTKESSVTSGQMHPKENRVHACRIDRRVRVSV